MKWHSESFADLKDRMSRWHLWFAWFPVFCFESSQTVRLENVKRRGIYIMHTGCWVWEYKRREND